MLGAGVDLKSISTALGQMREALEEQNAARPAVALGPRDLSGKKKTP
jgi:hypothetical protein